MRIIQLLEQFPQKFRKVLLYENQRLGECGFCLVVDICLKKCLHNMYQYFEHYTRECRTETIAGLVQVINTIKLDIKLLVIC